MVFQYPEYQLFAETVEKDVAFGLKNFHKELSEAERAAAVREALETVGLDFESVRGQSPFELSGGQKRRAAIAGVIVTKPEVLILDEPAAGLDPLGKRELMELLHSIHGGWCKTVIIVSHDMDESRRKLHPRRRVFGRRQGGAVRRPGRAVPPRGRADRAGAGRARRRPAARASCAARGIDAESDFTCDGFADAVLALWRAKGGDGHAQ